VSDVSALRASVEAALASVVPRRAPADLYDPYRYVMAGEGKRLRPVLLLLAAEACGVPAVEAMPAALATEVFHNFTLVHDDIMDRASTRRGRDTVHIRWDEPTAILAGDLMMGESYGLLAQTRAGDLRVLLEAWGEMVRRLCEGQMEDMRFATDPNVSVERYLRMIDGKTGALVAFCFEAGAILAGADADTRRHLHDAGIETGRAFQILDDLLDRARRRHREAQRPGTDRILIEGAVDMVMPGFETALDSPLVLCAQEAVRAAGCQGETGAWTAACEGGFLARHHDVPTVVLGPGDLTSQAHQPDEYITLEQLAAGETFMRKLMAECQAG